MRPSSGFAIGAVFALAAACAPSFQTLYEGDVRFEHCYALDEAPSATMEQKGTCWHDWVGGHTFGQTRDRVLYARARMRAIEQMRLVPTDDALMAAAPGAGADHDGQVAAPAPTTAFAPPPKVDDNAGVALSSRLLPAGAASAPNTAAPTPDAPGAVCVDACSQRWRACAETCRGAKDGCAACAADHVGCLAGCVKALKGAPVPKANRAARAD